ncbi:MAG: hypothetical protein R3F61_26470 [Myxococcota bacterium]
MCRDVIAKGAVRLGTPPEVGHAEVEWHHLACAAGFWPEAVLSMLGTDAFGEDGAAARRMAARLEVRRVDLDAAVADAKRGAWSEAIDVLLSAWWSTRSPEVAERITAISASEVERAGGIPTGRALEAFVSGLDAEDALQRGLAIAAAGRATKSAMPDALSAALTGPPDPRWIDLVLPWFDDPPWQNAGFVWERVRRIVDRLADPRVKPMLDVLRQERAGIAMRYGWDGAFELEAWVRSHDDAWFAAQLASTVPLDDAQRGALRALDGLLERRLDRTASAAIRLRDLYEAAAAGSADARLVLADLFAAEGDLRGEYLQLCAAEPDRRVRGRLRELEQHHWRALLGGLAPVVLKRGLRLEHGLPVEVVATSRRPADIEEVRSALEWASVEVLELPPPAGSVEGVVQLVSPAAVRLREIRAVLHPGTLDELLFAGPELPSVRSVVVLETAIRLPPAPVHGACRFPGLERLVLPPTYPTDVRRALAARLPRVQIDVHLPPRRR